MKTEKWTGDGYTLKPCPLCGAEPEERSPQENGDRFWTIRCPACGIRIGGSHRYMNQERWNTRAIEIDIKEVPGLVEKIMTAADQIKRRTK